MRIATRGEICTLLDDKLMAFTQFCHSEQGQAIKTLMDWNPTQDLDLPIMQQMLADLLAGGVIDQACVDRFNTFKTGITPDETIAGLSTVSYYSTTISNDLLLEVLPDYCEFLSDRVIWTSGNGKFCLSGTCSHPNVTAITMEEYYVR